MNMINIQEILPYVEMPSRYLGSEANSIRKDLGSAALKFALAFPDLYEIGTSHFGMQILYTILNRQEHIAAERFFTPAPDMERILREKKMPLFSLESEADLKSFDIIGFSLLYELNFTNILTMLSLSGIPFYSSEREGSWPLIIAGGPCAFNPEPLADFFDAFVVGDGEEVVLEISDLFISWKREGSGDRDALLTSLSKIQGVYVPRFFRADYDSNGIQRLEPLLPGYDKVRRAILPDISAAGFPDAPVVPFGKPVHDRLRLEIARGCSRGCRFCQAGIIYRPVRERSVENIVDMAASSLRKTGYSDLSLLSLSTGDYSNLAQLMEELMALNSGHCISISLPSIRAGKLNAPLMKIIKRVKKTGFTIAPEAGSQRLRDVINKNITEDDIFSTVNSAFDLGWRNIKLYFMNGLPTETDDDIKAIADMAKRLAAIKVRRGKSTINISFGTFIPKSHTPFQRSPQISIDRSFENLNFLKQNLRHPGINLKWQDPRMSMLEGVWARGDRRLSGVLIRAWEKGCRMDGWSDMFRFELWMEAFEECGIDPYFYTLRTREADENLPWSHIDSGVSEGFMESEFRKALEGTSTPDCRESGCTGCGICDFRTVKPVLFKQDEVCSEDPDGSESDKIFEKTEKKTEPDFVKLTFFYSKLGKAKFFGHLELAKIIRRAIRRVGIRVKYSTGFSPVMKVSFDNPLPVGMESEEEFFSIHADLSLKSGTIGRDDLISDYKIKPEELVVALNDVLPATISITRCVPSDLVKKKMAVSQSTSYRIDLKQFTVSRQQIDDFLSLSEYVVDKANFKGVHRSVDYRKITADIRLLPKCAVYGTGHLKDSEENSMAYHHGNPCSTLQIESSERLEMTLLNDGQRTIRPFEILTEVFNVSEDVLHAADTLKLKQY